MATVVTRVYQDKTTAGEVAASLLDGNFAARDVSVIDGGDAADQMLALGVGADVAEAASGKVAEGNAAVVVKAPFGKALLANKLVDAVPSVDLGLEKLDTYTSASAASGPDCVMRDHPKFLTDESFPGGFKGPIFSSFMGFGLLSKRKPSENSIYSGGRHIFGRDNLTSQRFGADCRGKHWHTISKWLSWQPVTHSRLNSRIRRDNPTPFSSALGWETISKR